LATGTTAWDLHAMGEYGVHLSADKELGGALARRLALGVDLYYEALLPHDYRTPTGSRHPLLLTYTPYVGSTYRLDPGDYSGASVQADLVAWRGPARATWLSRRDPAVAEGFPPVLAASARYTFNHLQQSDWSSDSALWDWDREKIWRPGYRNILTGTVLASLLRVGVPLQVYLSYRNTTWIPGKSAPAVNSYTAGLRLPVRF
jgi:hypothetical protein